jgi:hypothetical protein
LHIGQSIQLATRIRVFRQGLKAPHPAGREFKRWEFSRLFPIEYLRFDYILVDNQAEPLSWSGHFMRNTGAATLTVRRWTPRPAKIAATPKALPLR